MRLWQWAIGYFRRAGRRWNLAAALAGWLVPGLGPVLLGQGRRGGILVVTISLLWLAGLIIGGVSVIDSRSDRLWFSGQMLIGPSLLVDHYHQSLKAEADGYPEPPERVESENEDEEEPEPPVYEPAYGQMSAQGTLYTALAGLLNLLAMLDVVYLDPTDPRRAVGEQGRARKPGAG